MADGSSASGPGSRSAYPRISQAIGLLIVAMVLTILLDIPVWISTRRDTETRFVVMVVVHTFSIGLVILWGYLKAASPFRDVFPLKPLRLSSVVPMVLMLLGAIILAAELSFVVQLFWPKPAPLKEVARGMSGGSVFETFLAVGVVGPVTEELLFRGLILHGFLRNYSRRKAILVSALLFGLFHADPWQSPAALPLGIVLGWWLSETGSLLPCILGHALANSLRLLLPVVVGRHSVGHGGPVSGTGLPLGWVVAFGALGALFVGTGAWLLRTRRVRQAI